MVTRDPLPDLSTHALWATAVPSVLFVPRCTGCEETV